MLWKCCKFRKPSRLQYWKCSVFIPIPKKGNVKECSNSHTIALISHASKVMHKILQVRLQQYMNHELLDVQAGFRKGRGTRDLIANNCWVIKKQQNSRKTSTAAFLIMPSFWLITTNCGKFLKRCEYQTTLPASWEICMQIKRQQLEQTWNNRLVPNWERSTSRLCITTQII